MRIQVASDLHLEMVQRRLPGERLITPAPGADLLVLAGDIHSDVCGIEAFEDWPVPVLYVMGNHEFYHQHHDNLRHKVRGLMASMAETDSPTGSVLVLENERADFSRFGSKFGQWLADHAEELKGLRFLGCTLWTDYRHPDGGPSQLEQMARVSRSLNDHRVIGSDEGRFSVRHALEEHEQSRRWLHRELSTPFEGKTVVITHHGPHILSTHPRFAGNDINGAFVSHLPELVEKTDLWIHGHVHDSFDYRVGRGRVVANPRGYGANLHQGIKNATWENGGFVGDLVVEV